MLKNNTNYLVEFNQSAAKDIMHNSDSYTGKLLSDKQRGLTSLLFSNNQTQQLFTFKLCEIKPMPKLSLAFRDDAQPVIREKIHMRCVAISDQVKRPRPQSLFLSSDEDSGDANLDIGSENRGEGEHRGWIGVNEERNNQIRKMILKILQDNPEGNVSPKEVLNIIKQKGQFPIQRFVRQNMETYCEPSAQKTNRKYILLEKFRLEEPTRKRIKPNDD